MRVTPAKLSSYKSRKKSKQIIPARNKNNMSTVHLNVPSTDPYNNNIETLSTQELKNNVGPTQLSHSVTDNHSVGASLKVIPTLLLNN